MYQTEQNQHARLPLVSINATDIFRWNSVFISSSSEKKSALYFLLLSLSFLTQSNKHLCRVTKTLRILHTAYMSLVFPNHDFSVTWPHALALSLSHDCRKMQHISWSCRKWLSSRITNESHLLSYGYLMFASGFPKNFPHISNPLDEMLRKGFSNAFKYITHQQIVPFETLIKASMIASVLQSPQPHKPSPVFTDAPGYHINGFLFKTNPENSHCPAGFFQRNIKGGI